MPQLKALENPEEFEIDDEGPEITEDEYHKSCIYKFTLANNFLNNLFRRSPSLPACLLEIEGKRSCRRNSASSLSVKRHVIACRYCQTFVEVLSQINQRHLHLR